MNFNFNPQLFCLYGSLAIHSYGLFIAFGIALTLWCIQKNKRFSDLHLEKVYLDIFTVTIMAGCIGGRVLAIISEPYLYHSWYDWLTLWKGGFSALGSVLGIIFIMPLYLRKIHVPILPLFDLVSIYAPLMQSIGRLGCLSAGCCYGAATTHFLSITYTHPYCLAPQNIALYPTQLYSSIILFCIFLYMFFIGQYYFKKRGQLFAVYLICISLERFIIDFWRNDRIMTTKFLSFHQLVALCIITTIIVINHFFISKQKNNTSLL